MGQGFVVMAVFASFNQISILIYVRKFRGPILAHIVGVTANAIVFAHVGRAMDELVFKIRVRIVLAGLGNQFVFSRHIVAVTFVAGDDAKSIVREFGARKALPSLRGIGMAGDAIKSLHKACFVKKDLRYFRS